MAVEYYYDYWGSSASGVLPSWNFYTEPELINLAFTIATVKNYTDTPNGKIRSLFTISSGSVTPGQTYYRLEPFEVGTGVLSLFKVTNLTGTGISGIGTWRSDFAGGCFYDIGATGTFTPSKTDYTFSPTSLTTTQTEYIELFEATYNPVPSKATNPTPSDAADDVTLDQQTVTWENGGGATSYNVYYGIESGNLSLLESGVTDTNYTIFQISNGSPFDYEATRYWRIDAVNAYGTTTGDEWSFTTITFNPPPPGLRGFDSSGGGEGGFAGGAIGDGQMNIKTRLVAFARNKVFYEDT